MTTRRSLLLGAAGAVTVSALAGAPDAAFAQGAVIDITRARTNPIPIAIPDFAGTGDGQRFGRDIARVVQDNLRNSGLFRPVARQAFIQTPESAAQTPRFQDWRVIGAQALTTGRATIQGGNLRVEFLLWDILPENRLEGTAFTAATGNWRAIAHMISDAIYERLRGENGYVNTRSVDLAESGPRDRRLRRLALMEQDGGQNAVL
ncbi:MAG: Tol-Pal system protein TolB, partial [Alphaproteobacteria bacterium]